jgi:hypothetical protein
MLMGTIVRSGYTPFQHLCSRSITRITIGRYNDNIVADIVINVRGIIHDSTRFVLALRHGQENELVLGAISLASIGQNIVIGLTVKVGTFQSDNFPARCKFGSAVNVIIGNVKSLVSNEPDKVGDAQVFAKVGFDITLCPGGVAITVDNGTLLGHEGSASIHFKRTTFIHHVDIDQWHFEGPGDVTWNGIVEPELCLVAPTIETPALHYQTIGLAILGKNGAIVTCPDIIRGCNQNVNLRHV